MDSKYYKFVPGNWFYLVFIFLLTSYIFLTGHIMAGIISSIIFAILIFYGIYKSKRSSKQWKEFIENFSSNLNLAGNSTLVKCPFPLLIVSINGNLLWYNHKMSNILQKEDLLGKNIENISKMLNVEKIKASKEKVIESVLINKRYFDVFTSVIESNENLGENIVLMYFNEITETKGYLKNAKDSKEDVILLEVDNMDEALKSINEDKKPLLAAEIERTINNYAGTLKAMIRKYSSSKYVLTVQDKYIKEEMDKKFEILDTVREINIGNKLAVTISMGIGRGGLTPEENHQYAISAKELALGRGGDQTVVKSEDKLSFYGGKTKEVEKRTKVRARVIAHALNDLIKESSNVFIMGHKNPDFDCIGSAVGLYRTALSMKKECYIVMNTSNVNLKPVMQKFKDDEDYDGVFIDDNTCLNNIDDNSLLILTDVHNKGYVQNSSIVDAAKNIVIVDHHRRCADYIKNTLLSYIEPYASSTSELVTEMIQYMIDNPKLKPIEAEALMAGIFVDTKNFCFKTGVRTFEAAGFLRKLGADTIDVKKLFSNDLDSYLKRTEIIKNAKIKNKIAIAYAPEEIKDGIIVAQAADELLNISAVEASFVLMQYDNDVIVSARSLGDINVQVILEVLGGGGHMTMAGARISGKTMAEVTDILEDSINKYMDEENS